MIRSKEDYLHYLAEDLRHYQVKKYTLAIALKSPILRFQRRLRKIEYLTNCRSSNPFSKIYCNYLKLINLRLGIRLGFSVPINTIGPGLCFPHYGTIVISQYSNIGKNCRIHPGVGVGSYHGAPNIGDNVYLGPGAKIFGAITIGDNVSVGANSVVTKNVEANVSVAGVPAEVISKKTTFELGMFPEGFLEQ